MSDMEPLDMVMRYHLETKHHLLISL